MALKNSLSHNLSDQQRRFLEELKQTAQELLTDAESKPSSRKKNPQTG